MCDANNMNYLKKKKKNENHECVAAMEHICDLLGNVGTRGTAKFLLFVAYDFTCA